MNTQSNGDEHLLDVIGSTEKNFICTHSMPIIYVYWEFLLFIKETVLRRYPSFFRYFCTLDSKCACANIFFMEC